MDDIGRVQHVVRSRRCGECNPRRGERYDLAIFVSLLLSRSVLPCRPDRPAMLRDRHPSLVPDESTFMTAQSCQHEVGEDDDGDAGGDVRAECEGAWGG